MSALRLVPVVALGAGISLLAAPVGAAPKTVQKSFAVNIPVPGGAISDPTSSAMCAPATSTPQSTHLETLTAPAAGSLKVEVTGFVGDWDLALEDAKGKRVADGDNASVTPTSMSTGSTVEKLTFKVKKPGKYTIVVCNFAGGPTGNGKYVFSYGR